LIDILTKFRAWFLTNGIGVVRWFLMTATCHFFLGSWNTYSFNFHECVYIAPQMQAETERAFKLRVYDTLRTMCTTEKKPRDVRIV